MRGKRSHFNLHSLVYGENIFFYMILCHCQFMVTPFFFFLPGIFSPYCFVKAIYLVGGNANPPSIIGIAYSLPVCPGCACVYVYSIDSNFQFLCNYIY